MEGWDTMVTSEKIIFLMINDCYNVSRINFNRGYWTGKIVRKYQNNLKIFDTPITESASILNVLSFPPWLVIQLIRKFQAFPFIFNKEINWRIGLMKGLNCE